MAGTCDTTLRPIAATHELPKNALRSVKRLIFTFIAQLSVARFLSWLLRVAGLIRNSYARGAEESVMALRNAPIGTTRHGKKMRKKMSCVEVNE